MSYSKTGQDNLCNMFDLLDLFSSGKPQGVGILEWGGDGEGMEMGRSVYEQPETKVDGILSRQGGFPSKEREMERKQEGIRKGKQKARGLRHNCVVTIYMYILMPDC
jgi:hypothetical protein